VPETDRSPKRYIVFQMLPDTLGLGPDAWRVLSKCHDMRNRKVAEKVEGLPPIAEGLKSK
jgi:hypothetical protein